MVVKRRSKHGKKKGRTAEMQNAGRNARRNHRSVGKFFKRRTRRDHRSGHDPRRKGPWNESRLQKRRKNLGMIERVFDVITTVIVIMALIFLLKGR